MQHHEFRKMRMKDVYKRQGDRENATYGSGTYGDGYPVNVIQRDSQFDSCDDGHLFYSTDEGAWRYYCNYGGAQNAGPYYLYSVGTVNFTEQNIFVSESDTLSLIHIWHTLAFMNIFRRAL